MKKKSLENFTNDQLSLWPLARDNYRSLKNAETRTMTIGGLEVRLQHNPARIVSTSAKVDAGSVGSRKCFLCRDNRPAEQIKLRFDGRKGKRYDILVNPYPVFPEHLVIAMEKHCDQSIWNRYVDMLDLARAYRKYVFMYNGPKCGASAPDHHHFQAAWRGIMPLECDVDRLLDTITPETHPEDRSGSVDGRGSMDKDAVLRYLTSVKEAELYHYRRFAHGIFVLRASTAKSMAKLFYRLLDCAEISDGKEEPMFNLITWHTGEEYRSAVMFRAAHRSSHYFSQDPDHLMISPGCADMAGFFVVPCKDDFEKITPDLLSSLVSEVALSPEREKTVIDRLTRTQPRIAVGIMCDREISFEILSDGAGVRKAVWREGKIEYGGALYDELYFEEQTLSTMFAEAGFVLYGVTIGTGFHWERKETQRFAGALKIVVEKDRLRAVNIVGVEDYLLSVISSEMKSTSSLEFLKAHAVISRSWVMSRILHTGDGAGKDLPDWMNSVPALVSHLDSITHRGEECRESSVVEDIRWYGQEDHKGFDVCADDHCQRYQGLTRAVGLPVRKAVDSTWGEVLVSDGRLCDARFSKCCGGVTERFGTCWEDREYPYLSPVADSPDHAGRDGHAASAAGAGLPDLSDEETARRWIISPETYYGNPGDCSEGGAGVHARPFCDTADDAILSQVLNDYDRETADFFRWSVRYGRRELSDLISSRSGHDIGLLLALVPEHRGASGRIDRLRIIGDRMTLVVGKELEIRRVLSHSHLKSSAFAVEYADAMGMRIPHEVIERKALEGAGHLDFDYMVLYGAGWGHGVGLCQIGAAVMAAEGYDYHRILGHYYPGAETARNHEE